MINLCFSYKLILRILLTIVLTARIVSYRLWPSKIVEIRFRSTPTLLVVKVFSIHHFIFHKSVLIRHLNYDCSNIFQIDTYRYIYQMLLLTCYIYSVLIMTILSLVSIVTCGLYDIMFVLNSFTCNTNITIRISYIQYYKLSNNKENL